MLGQAIVFCRLPCTVTLQETTKRGSAVEGGAPVFRVGLPTLPFCLRNRSRVSRYAAGDRWRSGWGREETGTSGTDAVGRAVLDRNRLTIGLSSLRVARIPPEANASVNTSRLIVTYLAAELSMPPFFPGSPALPLESR